MYDSRITVPVRARVPSSFINLSTSKSIEEVGKHSIKKLTTTLKMYFNVLYLLVKNKYDLVYVSITANPPGFYKDFLLVILIKLFNCIRSEIVNADNISGCPGKISS